MFVQQGLGLFGRGAFAYGDEPLARCHDVFDLQVVTGFKSQIAVGDDAYHLARIAHRKTRNTQLIGQSHDLPDRVSGCDDDRVEQHTTFVALDFGDFCGLLLRREVLMNDTHATFLRYGNGESGFGDRVHGR